MVEYYFEASSVLGTQLADNGTLLLQVLALVPGTEVPVRDSRHNVIAKFVATEDLIKKAINNFNGKGIFDVDHINGSDIGTFDDVFYNNGFCASGEVVCPVWQNRIINKEYTGVSIQGPLVGEIEAPDSIFIERITFLSEERSPKGGACPIDKCDVIEGSVMKSDEQTDEVKAEAKWEPNYDAFWKYIEDENGAISKTKARKIFLKMSGDGSNRGDWSYPVAKISDGEPVLDEEGLMAAYKRAAQQEETTLFKKIASKMRSLGMEIPDGLKSKIEAKFEASFSNEDGVAKVRAFLVDPTNGTKLAEKEFIFIANKGDDMSEEVEKTEEIKVTEPAKEATLVREAVFEGMDFDKVIKDRFGATSEEISASVREIPVLRTQLDDAMASLKSANEKIDSYKLKEEEAIRTTLKNTLPPALFDGEGAEEKIFQEYTANPATFMASHMEALVKFAAAKDEAKMEGSAAVSDETIEAEEELARKAQYVKDFLKRSGVKV